MDVWSAFLQALWLFLPCYMANMAPVAAARILPRWEAPLDGGRLAPDGRRVLGAHKTWRGLAAGIFAGSTTALLLALFAGGPWVELDFGLATGARLPAVAAFGAVLGAMALAGDAAKSYFKRRTGRDGGAPWVPFDQLDFVVGGLLGAVVGAPLVGVEWTFGAYFGDWLVLGVLVLMTPVLHWASSVLAYGAGIKRAPW